MKILKTKQNKPPVDPFAFLAVEKQNAIIMEVDRLSSEIAKSVTAMKSLLTAEELDKLSDIIQKLGMKAVSKSMLAFAKGAEFTDIGASIMNDIAKDSLFPKRILKAISVHFP